MRQLKYDVTLLTDARYVAPEKANWYVQNILDEDQLLTAALEKRGLKVFRTNWDDKQFNWSETKCIVFRTTWDYFHRFTQFEQWLNEVSEQTQLINPLNTIRWNMDKHYLRDLHVKQITVPPTVLIETGEKRMLKEISESTNWKEFILKPAISGAARHTYRFKLSEVDEHETIFRELVHNESMLLQEFQQQVLTKGEVAFMSFQGKYSHAVLKKAKPGDFRVQDDFGGTVHEYTPSLQEISFAEHVVAACEPVPAYARVDVIWDNRDQLCVSELELIEPELWMRKFPLAADLFAEAIVNAMQ